MKKGIICGGISLCLGLLLFSHLGGEDLKGRWGVGINYPGTQVKYGLASHHLLAGKVQYGTEDKGSIWAIGSRYYFLLNPQCKIVALAGGEADFVIFNNVYSLSGTGWAFEPFIGLEYFPSSSLGLQADFGPAWISLTDKESGVSLGLGAPDWVINLEITYYFGGKKKLTETAQK